MKCVRLALEQVLSHLPAPVAAAPKGSRRLGTVGTPPLLLFCILGNVLSSRFAAFAPQPRTIKWVKLLHVCKTRYKAFSWKFFAPSFLTFLKWCRKY